jgi:hypothetical protein
MSPEPEYPFVPKSSVRLAPGDFWAIPLADATYACGRVIAPMPRGMPGNRIGFLGALLDWHGPSLPTSDSIAGAKAIEQGVMHILAITESGGMILGHRPLELDGIEPWTFAHGSVLQRGFTPVRALALSDRGQYPTLSWWGYDVVQIKANALLASGRGV